jgi:radical SAM superfamily enzyme YgiQ (UPF0313 family)
MGLRRARRLGRSAPIPGDGEGSSPHHHVRSRERQAACTRSPEEGPDAGGSGGAITNAKDAGIEIVHGFFVVGNPDETVDNVRATFNFAPRLRLDTFAFNRLCVYRGTPLWQEYVSADWSTMRLIGTSTSSARRSIPPTFRAR